MSRNLIAAGKVTTTRIRTTGQLSIASALLAGRYTANAARAILTTMNESGLPFREVRDAKIDNLWLVVKRLERIARDLSNKPRRKYEESANIWRAVITELTGATITTIKRRASSVA